MTPDPLAYLPLHQLAPRIARGELSPVALVEAALARIERLDPGLHAFVEVYAETALRAARGLAELRAAGHLLGPLHGIPIAIKDLCDIAGRPTGFGSRSWPQPVPASDSTVVRRLRAAGAIILGKTHLVEFAFGGWGTNQSLGTPRNPWDPALHRVPGGSSSGSGVAVAAGLVPAAIGSDTGGSIRIPSSFCGLVGLKATVGRVSNAGVAPLVPSLDTLGPMTRSVEDAALLFEAIAGPDPADPATAGHAPPQTLAGLRAGIAGMRLAIMAAADRAECEPEVLAAYDAALARLKALGAELIERPLPSTAREYQRVSTPLMMAEGFAVHQDWIERPDFAVDPHVRTRLLGGKTISAAQYLRARDEQRAAQRAFLAALAGADALLVPTTPHAAIPVAEVDETQLTISRFTRFGNYLGLCGLALPDGFSAADLPLSLQIVGRPYDEATVLRIGWAYENATPWHERHPAI